jgi:hypothetical protein
MHAAHCVKFCRGYGHMPNIMGFPAVHDALFPPQSPILQVFAIRLPRGPRGVPLLSLRSPAMDVIALTSQVASCPARANWPQIGAMAELHEVILTRCTKLGADGLRAAATSVPHTSTPQHLSSRCRSPAESTRQGQGQPASGHHPRGDPRNGRRWRLARFAHLAAGLFIVSTVTIRGAEMFGQYN